MSVQIDWDDDYTESGAVTEDGICLSVERFGSDHYKWFWEVSVDFGPDMGKCRLCGEANVGQDTECDGSDDDYHRFEVQYSGFLEDRNEAKATCERFVTVVQQSIGTN